MGMKKWEVSPLNKALAKELAAECDTDPIVALIAAARGYTDPADLEEFLSDEPCFADPRMLADIETAAALIENGIENGIKIAVFGDYDCDGVVSATLLSSYLKKRGADCVYYIPDRFAEGYGMNIAAVEKLAAQGVGLLITVDNGIACHAEVDRAKALGMTVVVTDHHLPGDTLPQADAVVDPHRRDCPSEFKEICGAQVAFSLICVMERCEPEELLPYFADLLSLAVVADVMPLKQENRAIVKQGIEKLKTAPATGLSALLNVAGIALDSVSAGRIAFGLAPRVNAAGRMGKADRAVELLLSDNMLHALEIANELDTENANRRETEQKILDDAVRVIEEHGYQYDRVIVADGENWHRGIIGIAASRITERYGKPAILIAREGATASGSGRSIEGFSLYQAIKAASDSLVRFGGHALAAGVTLESEKIPQFREKINAYAAGLPLIPPILRLDCRLNPSGLTTDLALALKALEPFGQGNPAPLFGVFGVTLRSITPVGGGKHLRLAFTKDAVSFEAMLFGMPPERFCFEPGDLLDAAVTLEVKPYGGELSLTVQIKALRISGTDDDRLFAEADSFDAFMAGRDYDVHLLLPSRAEVGEIFRHIVKKPCLADGVKYRFLKTVGYAKAEVALLTLIQLGLIEQNAAGQLKATDLHQKTDLKNADIYRNLLERSGAV